MFPCSPTLLDPVTMLSCQLNVSKPPWCFTYEGPTESPYLPGAQVYIYSESYGGKMAAQFALAIHRAQQKRHIYLTFRSAHLPDAVFCRAQLQSLPAKAISGERHGQRFLASLAWEDTLSSLQAGSLCVTGIVHAAYCVSAGLTLHFHGLSEPEIPRVRRGVFLGDSWIAPVDFSQAWLPYLKALSLLDGAEYDDMQRIVERIKVLAG